VRPEQQYDPRNPEEHLVEFLRNMPSYVGVGMVTNFGFLKTWARHLWRCGVAHRSYLEKLADENGMIHVSQLPKQQIRFQQAFRGPNHQYNNAARWVEVSDRDPEPFVVQDPRAMTLQEQEAQLGIYREMGRIPTPPPQPIAAEVLDD
jgi:hypothetical protein